MDITNCRLKSVSYKDLDGNYMYGFVLAARKHIHEFFTIHKSERDEWIEELKSFVVLLDLKDELIIKALLGKGNSAKVHQCERKSNPSQVYALKTINKSYIKQKDLNKVSSVVHVSPRLLLGFTSKGDRYHAIHRSPRCDSTL